MNKLFVSYGRGDRETANRVCEELEACGYQPFLDASPRTGIPAGEDWERMLLEKLKCCELLVLLISRQWLASQWCFAELAVAKAYGKELLALVIDNEIRSLPAELSRLQAVWLSDPDAWPKLRRGLATKVTSPDNPFPWPIANEDPCPYPGLMAFETFHAGVFFGRDREIQRLREKMNQLRDAATERMILLVGASGSGKSSLVKAGLIPRLEQSGGGRWLVLPVFRWALLRSQGRAWREFLADALIKTASVGNEHASRSPASLHSDTLALGEWKQRFVASVEPARSAREFIDATKRLLERRANLDVTPLLVIDQFEELLLAENDQAVQECLSFLFSVMSAPDSPWRILVTLRTDHLRDVQSRPDFLAWSPLLDMFSLGPMLPEEVPDVVRLPAERVNVGFESEELVRTIVADSEAEDSLALLAFTLRRLFEGLDGKRQFTQTDYQVRLGGVRGALTGVAEKCLDDAAKELRISRDACERIVRHLFVNHLVRCEKGKATRRTVPSRDLPAEFQTPVSLLIDGRLLCSRPLDESHPDAEVVVEVAHEQLLEKWDRLATWLRESRELLLWREDVEASRVAAGAHWPGLTARQYDWLCRLGDVALNKGELEWKRNYQRRKLRRQTVIVGLTAAFLVAVAYVAWSNVQSRLARAREGALVSANDRFRLNTLLSAAADAEPQSPENARKIWDAEIRGRLPSDFCVDWIERRCQRTSATIEYPRNSEPWVRTLSLGGLIVAQGRDVRHQHLDGRSEHRLTLPPSAKLLEVSRSGKLIGLQEGHDLVIYESSGKVRARTSFEPDESVTDLCFSTDDSQVAVAITNAEELTRVATAVCEGLDQNATKPPPLALVTRHESRLFDKCEFVSPNELLVGELRATLWLKSSRRDEETERWEGRLLACDPMSRRIVVASIYGDAQAISIKGDRSDTIGEFKAPGAFGTPSGNEGVVAAAAITAGGRWLATAHSGGYAPGVVAIWDVSTGKQVCKLTSFHAKFSDGSARIAFWPDERGLVILDRFSHLRRWVDEEPRELKDSDAVRTVELIDVPHLPRAIPIPGWRDVPAPQDGFAYSWNREASSDLLLQIGLKSDFLESSLTLDRELMGPRVMPGATNANSAEELVLTTAMDGTMAIVKQGSQVRIRTRVANTIVTDFMGDVQNCYGWTIAHDNRLIACFRPSEYNPTNKDFVEVVLWDAWNGQERLKFALAKGLPMAFSSDSRTLAMLDVERGEILLWESSHSPRWDDWRSRLPSGGIELRFDSNGELTTPATAVP